MIDRLTGAHTRTFLQSVFPQRLEACKKAGIPLALFLMDIDHFKVINDSFGHARGDEILREFADRIRRVLRKGDILCRYGGDEFVVVAEHLSRDEALALGERMLSVIADTPFAGTSPLSISVSIGVALFPEDAVTVESLLQVADNRHYEAKRQGRGRLIGHTRITTRGSSQAQFFASGRLIERDAHMQTFLAFLETMHRAKRGVLVVHGDRGCGQTRFLQELSKRARLYGFTPLHLKANEARMLRVYGAFLSAQQRIPKLANTFLGRHYVAEVIQAYVADKESQGLFITIDGADTLDSGSVRSLIALFESDIPQIVVAYAPEAQQLRPLEQRARAHEMVTLGPFSRAGLAVWLRHTLLHEPDPAFVEWLFHQSDGKPAVAHAILKRLQTHGLLVFNGQHWIVSPYIPALTADSPLMQMFFTPPLPSTPPLWRETFVGRAEELNQLTRHIQNHRLVALVGRTGVGKTRLAVQLAGEIAARSKWRLLFLAVHEWLDATLLPYALLHALGIRPERGDIWRQVEQALAGYEWLIVLDGIDDIEDGASFLTQLLTRSAHVRVLTTGRTPLDADAVVFPVNPLSVPEEGETLQEIDRFESVLLFIHEARRAYSHFAFGNDWQLWREIVACTHGIPMLIRLLARWVDFHTPDEWQAMLQTCEQLHTIIEIPVLTFLWQQFSPEEHEYLRLLAALPVPVSFNLAQVCTQATPFFLSALIDHAFLQTFDERLTMPQLFRTYVQKQYPPALQEEALRSIARRAIEALPAYSHDTDAVPAWAQVMQRDAPFWKWLLFHVDWLDAQGMGHLVEQVARWFLLTGNASEGVAVLARAVERVTSPQARAHLLAWQARLLMQVSHPETALALLKEATLSLQGTLLEDALVSRAEALHAMGADQQRQRILERISPHAETWPDTRARLLLLQSDINKGTDESSHLAQQAMAIALQHAAPSLVARVAVWLHTYHRKYGYILPSREWGLQAIPYVERIGSVSDLIRLYDVAAMTFLLWHDDEQAEGFYAQALEHASRTSKGSVWLSVFLHYLLVLALQRRWRELVPGLFLFVSSDGFRTCQDTTDRWLAVLIALAVLEHEARDPVYTRAAHLRAQLPATFSDALLQMVHTLLPPVASSERRVERPEDLWHEVARLVERQLFDGAIGTAMEAAL